MTGENLNPDSATEDKGESKDAIAGLEAALSAERGKRQVAERREAEARGLAEGLSHRPDVPAKTLSAADLRGAVDEGRMSEDEADAIKEQQSEKRIGDRLTNHLDTTLASHLSSSKISGEIARYKSAVPEITDTGSAQYAKIQEEFDYLVSMGNDPKDPRTELLAARAAFGSVSALENVAKAKPRETYAETGGGSDANPGPSDKDGWDKGMSSDQKAYYNGQISKGVLKDIAAANTEFTYKPQHNPRHAA